MININQLRVEDLRKQYKEVEEKILKLKDDKDSKVTSNGDAVTLTEPLLNKRVISDTEKLILEQTLEEEDARKFLLKDKEGKEIGINPINYTAVLPGSTILSPDKAGTIDFINILKFSIQRFGTRDIYVITKGRMERSENRLCRYLSNIAQYPQIRACIKGSQGVLKNGTDGITSYDENLDISKTSIKPNEVKDLAETIYNNGVDSLNQSEIKDITEKLTGFFDDIPLPG